MGIKFDLTDSETEIMEYLWQKDDGASFKDLLDYFINIKQKCWKKQTLRAFLIKLEKKQFVYIDKTDSKYVYSAMKSKDEYTQSQTNVILNNLYGGSIFDFFVSFTGGKKLSQESAKKLKDLLDEEK